VMKVYAHILALAIFVSPSLVSAVATVDGNTNPVYYDCDDVTTLIVYDLTADDYVVGFEEDVNTGNCSGGVTGYFTVTEGNSYEWSTQGGSGGGDSFTGQPYSGGGGFDISEVIDDAVNSSTASVISAVSFGVPKIFLIFATLVALLLIINIASGIGIGRGLK